MESRRHRLRAIAVALVAAALAACGTLPRQPRAPSSPSAASPPSSSKYYKDDGPGERPLADLDSIPDAVPRLEPLNRFANRPYTVLGRDYVPATTLRPYRERGVASWYGRKFHGQKTSTGEVYDMYAMTAAHPTLPLPSYARITNPANGRSVVVRVNDRGPFLYDRLIDLSYAAAHRLGIAAPGSGEVEVESLIPANAPVAVTPLPPVALAPVSAAAPAAASATPSASAETAPAASPPAPVAQAGGGFVVQLGAFANFANAQAFLEHVQNQTTAARVEARVRQVNGLYRVYTGPFADRDEARLAAERITQAFGLAAIVAVH